MYEVRDAFIGLLSLLGYNQDYCFVIVTDETDFDAIYTYLEGQEAKCYDIGTRLHLKQNLLDKIKREAIDLTDAMRKIITNWLQQNYDYVRTGPPSWKMLAVAIQAPNGGTNTVLAEKIAKEHPAKGNHSYCFLY